MLRKILIVVTLAYMAFIATRLNASIYWVVETVVADNVGTVNTFADPYGVLQAFTDATCGDEIRIVQGASDYDSTTSSWTNRQADKALQATRTCATLTSPVTFSCWSDETTQVTTLGGCLFNFATGTGNGFHFFNAGRVIQNIGVDNASSNGWVLSPDTVAFMLETQNSGADGFESDTVDVLMLSCSSHNNTAVGYHIKGEGLLINSTSYLNTSHGVQIDSTASGGIMLVNNLIYDNDVGVVAQSVNITAVGNTIYSNADDGISVIGAGNSWGTSYFNLITDNGGWGSDFGGSAWITIGNNYYNNTLGTKTNTSGLALNEESTPDTSVVAYVNAAGGNFVIDSGADRTIVFPEGNTTDTGLKGAVQTTGAAGGGATAFAH